MAFGSKKVRVLPDPDPAIASKEIRESEENRQKAFARFIVRQRLRGPSQLSASSPGLRFLTRRRTAGLPNKNPDVSTSPPPSTSSF